MGFDSVRIAIPLVVGYLVGGIPWSLIVGKKFYNVDPRDHGSGNLGATNVLRTLGVRAAAVVLALDIGKGALAVAVAMLFCPPSVTGAARDWLLIGVAMTSVLGHTYSPYIRFKGGKGVATAAGAIAVVMPHVWLPLLFTFVAVVAVSRMVSLGSVLVAIEFPLLVMWVYQGRTAFLIFAVVAASFVIYRHRQNIVRISRGEESRLSWSRRGEAVTKDSED